MSMERQACSLMMSDHQSSILWDPATSFMENQVYFMENQKCTLHGKLKCKMCNYYQINASLSIFCTSFFLFKSTCKTIFHSLCIIPCIYYVFPYTLCSLSIIIVSCFQLLSSSIENLYLLYLFANILYR